VGSTFCFSRNLPDLFSVQVSEKCGVFLVALVLPNEVADAQMEEVVGDRSFLDGRRRRGLRGSFGVVPPKDHTDLVYLVVAQNPVFKAHPQPLDEVLHILSIQEPVAEFFHDVCRLHHVRLLEKLLGRLGGLRLW
jgi:hypothetical protein